MKTDIKDFKFRIDSINIINSSIQSPLERTEVGELDFDLQIQVKLELKGSMILVFVNAVIKTKEPIEKVGHYTVCCAYVIENLNEHIIYDKKKKPSVPKHIIQTLNSISISTLRGLMFGSYRGTFLHDAILPIVDPKLIEAYQIP